MLGGTIEIADGEEWAEKGVSREFVDHRAKRNFLEVYRLPVRKQD